MRAILLSIVIGIMIVAVMGNTQTYAAPPTDELTAVVMVDFELSPPLDITRFSDYYLYANVTSDATVDTVLANVSGLNGEGFYAWNYYVNGTPYCDNITKEMDYVSGDMYRTIIRPDDIYPEIFFAPDDIIYNNAPLNMNLYRQNYQLFHYQNPFQLTNGTNIWIEFNAVANSLASPQSTDLQVYIVERGKTEAFFNSDWRGSADVELIATVSPNDAFDHTHTANSSHHTIMVTADANGTVGNKNINVTDDFWVVLYSSSNTISRGWTLKYHPATLATNTNNWFVGNRADWSTTHQTGVPDAHVHLVRRETVIDGVNITLWANDTAGASINAYDDIYFAPLPNQAPNPTQFISPTNGTHTGTLNISWVESTDPNDDALTYTLSLLNNDNTVNSVLATNTALTYIQWDSRYVANGHYDLKVVVSDGTLTADFTHSGRFDVFEIYNPSFGITSPATATGMINAVQIEGTIYQFTITGTYTEPVRWSFGDGQTSSEASPVHEFGHGLYTVMAEDNAGRMWTTQIDTRQVFVDRQNATVVVGGHMVHGGVMLATGIGMCWLAGTNQHFLGVYMGKWKGILVMFYTILIIVGGLLVVQAIYLGA